MASQGHGKRESTALGTLVVILLVVIAMILIAYYAWYVPVRQDRA